MTLLHRTVKKGFLKFAKLLVKHGANVNATDRNGITPLLCAIHKANLKMTEFLLSHDAATDDPRLLCYAAQDNHLDIANSLLMAGVDVNTPDEYGVIPLLYASFYGHTDMVQMLLAHGALVNLAAEGAGFTPLHAAIEENHEGVVRLLLDHGADVQERTNTGVTALHLAAFWEHQDIVKDLMLLGADVNCVDEQGSTPMHLAAVKGHQDLVKELLHWGAHVDCKDEQDCTPLHFAAARGHWHIVSTLLRHGADANICDKGNDTALATTLKEDRLLHFDYDTVFNFFKNECNYSTTIQVLVRHLVKMKMQNIYVSEMNEQLLCSNDAILEYSRRCEKELRMMDSEHIADSTVTYFAVLVKSSHLLAGYLRNEEVTQVLLPGAYRNNFPEYTEDLEVQISGGLQLRELLEGATNVLRRVAPGTEMPLTCIDKVLGYLDNDDLTRLCKLKV